jgi:hypothetical protein
VIARAPHKMRQTLQQIPLIQALDALCSQILKEGSLRESERAN